jgi:chromosome partitioning protein
MDLAIGLAQPRDSAGLGFVWRGQLVKLMRVGLGFLDDFVPAQVWIRRGRRRPGAISRQADEPEVISGQASRLPMLIEAARANGADLILIDTPPQADTIALSAAKAADIVLVPIRPAIWDLQAAQPSLLLAQVASRPAFIVLNGVRPNSNVGLEAEAGLIGQGAQVAPVMLKQRVQYEYAVRDGRTVQEAYPNETAAEEVA